MLPKKKKYSFSILSSTWMNKTIIEDQSPDTKCRGRAKKKKKRDKKEKKKILETILVAMNQEVLSQIKVNTWEDLLVEEAISDLGAFHLRLTKPSSNPRSCGSPGGNA
jgi:hypothetical protein